MSRRTISKWCVGVLGVLALSRGLVHTVSHIHQGEVSHTHSVAVSSDTPEHDPHLQAVASSSPHQHLPHTHPHRHLHSHPHTHSHTKSGDPDEHRVNGHTHSPIENVHEESEVDDQSVSVRRWGLGGHRHISIVGFTFTVWDPSAYFTELLTQLRPQPSIGTMSFVPPEGDYWTVDESENLLSKVSWGPLFWQRRTGPLSEIPLESEAICVGNEMRASHEERPPTPPPRLDRPEFHFVG